MNKLLNLDKSICCHEKKTAFLAPCSFPFNPSQLPYSAAPGHVKPLKFVGHAKKPEKKSPVDVFLVDPSTGEHSILYSTDGSTISGGSMAIIYGKHLYISQVFDPFILKVELEP